MRVPAEMNGGPIFTRHTAVVTDSDRPGRWRAEVPGIWGAPTFPQGGIVTAVAVRAMAAELATPEQRLRSVTTVFAAPVAAGAMEIDVTVIRRGRSLSQLSATVRNPGEDAGHTSIAVFGSARPGFEFSDLRPPEVPPPERSVSFRDIPADYTRRVEFPYWNQVEGRIALGNPWWSQFEPGAAERASWYRFDDPPLVAGGVLDPAAVVTLCDTMPGAIGERMGSGLPFWLPPSADLTIHILGDAGPGWLLGHNRARWAGDGYASAEITLWDPTRGLVAYATQVMCFVFPDGPPPPEQRRPRV
jgi:acyl-CoA thioesterase